MSELLSQLGINWKLLFSQAANFLILLVVLRMFAYKPLLQLMKERRERIEEGLVKADEADRRLGEIDEMAKARMKQTEQEALAMLKETEKRAEQKESEMLSEAKKKEAAVLAEADMVIKARAEEMRKKVENEAAQLVRAALVKAVELKPDAVDEVLLKKAVAVAKKS